MHQMCVQCTVTPIFVFIVHLDHQRREKTMRAPCTVSPRKIFKIIGLGVSPIYTLRYPEYVLSSSLAEVL